MLLCSPLEIVGVTPRPAAAATVVVPALPVPATATAIADCWAPGALTVDGDIILANICGRPAQKATVK